MLDAMCFFCQAQDQIMVLRTVKLLRLIRARRVVHDKKPKIFKLHIF